MSLADDVKELTEVALDLSRKTVSHQISLEIISLCLMRTLGDEYTEIVESAIHGMEQSMKDNNDEIDDVMYRVRSILLTVEE